VISSVALLQENPHPNEQAVREAIAGNLCRCTGLEGSNSYGHLSN